MENKTTAELINLLYSLVDKKSGNLKEGYQEALDELKSREPFFMLLNEDFEESIPSILKRIEEMEEDIKLLKRHKHDEKTSDVMVRI